MCYVLQYIDVGKYEEVPKPMPKEQIIMLKAITDESRLRIIKLLEQGEQCAYMDSYVLVTTFGSRPM